MLHSCIDSDGVDLKITLLQRTFALGLKDFREPCRMFGDVRPYSGEALAILRRHCMGLFITRCFEGSNPLAASVGISVGRLK